MGGFVCFFRSLLGLADLLLVELDAGILAQGIAGAWARVITIIIRGGSLQLVSQDTLVSLWSSSGLSP